MLTSRVDHSNNTLATEVTQLLSFPDFLGHWQKKAREGLLSYGEILDARAAVIAFTAEEIEIIVSMLNALAQASTIGPVAVVVGNNLSFGIIRILGARLEGVCRIEPFREIEKAERSFVGRITKTARAM
jgi:hypothetical protein